VKRGIFACAWVLTAFAVGACGSDPYCGDGSVDPGEQCDDGNGDETDFCLSSCVARVIPSLTVKWSFNESEELGFTGDNCTDTGAFEVEVTVDGAVTETITESCAIKQIRFVDLAPGSYDISLDVKSAGGSDLTSSPITLAYDFSGGDQEVTLVVPFDAWTGSYDGNYFFRVTWDGADCAAATTPVVEQVLDLTRGGEYVATETKTMDSLQGATSPCRALTENEPQTILDVPFGPATLLIQGLDTDSNVVYETSFETFIGAGVNNPELVFDVAAVVE